MKPTRATPVTFPTQRFAAALPLFSDTKDPDYITMLQAIQEGRRQMLLDRGIGIVPVIPARDIDTSGIGILPVIAARQAGSLAH